MELEKMTPGKFESIRVGDIIRFMDNPTLINLVRGQCLEVISRDYDAYGRTLYKISLPSPDRDIPFLLGIDDTRFCTVEHHYNESSIKSSWEEIIV